MKSANPIEQLQFSNIWLKISNYSWLQLIIAYKKWPQLIAMDINSCKWFPKDYLSYFATLVFWSRVKNGLLQLIMVDYSWSQLITADYSEY